MSNKNNRQLFKDLASNAIQKIGQTEKKETRSGLTPAIATRDRTIDFYTVAMAGLPNPDPVLKKMNRAIEVYEDLTYDSRVKACRKSRRSAVQSMEWDVLNEKSVQSEIDFHKDYLLTYKMEDKISEILDAPAYGYKPHEIIWEEVNGKLVPVDLVGKPSRWFKYDKDNQLRFLTAKDMIIGEELPENRFIVARNEPTYDNPYGENYLSACFWPVIFRKNGFKFWTIFMEKYGMPFLLSKAPEGERTEKIKEVADMLENMLQDAIAVVPKEYEVEMLETSKGGSGSKSGGGGAHSSYINAMNIEIAMSILGTNLTTEVQGGSFAASQSHMAVREDIIESDARIAEGVFNELIEITHKLNFGNSPPPQFKLFAEEKVDEERSKRDFNLSKTGVKFTSNYYKRAYNLTDEDIDENVEPVAAPVVSGEEGLE